MKKRKRGPKGVPPEMGPKIVFYIRTVKRNRNEIEAQKKSDFEHPTKTKKMKENEKMKKRKDEKISKNEIMKENEKCKKMKK